jgi:hypothetical protein
MAAPIHVHTKSIQKFTLLHTFVNTCYHLSFLIIAILMGLRWYYLVVLICISLIISGIEPLCYFYGSFLCLLWRNVYSGPLPIFLNQVVSFLTIKLHKFFIYFAILTPYKYGLQIFFNPWVDFSFCWLFLLPCTFYYIIKFLTYNYFGFNMGNGF